MRKNDTLQNLIERILLLPIRLRTRARSRSRYAVRAQTIAATRRTLGHLATFNATSHGVVFNVGLYLLLLDQDLADFTDDLVCAIGARKRSFIAKHEATLLYEASEDITQLLGREFWNAVNAMGISEQLLRRLKAESSDLNQFWQTHREFLGTIRKALAAHREQNALLYLDSLEQLKPLEVMARAADLSGLIGRLLSSLQEVSLNSSDQASILRDMLESSRKH